MEIVRTKPDDDIPEGAIASLLSNPNLFVVVASHAGRGDNEEPADDDFGLDDDAGESQALTAPPGDSFVPLPELRPNVASHLHISGPSGCGKSSFANLMSKSFIECHAGPVIVISADGTPDPNFTNVTQRIPVDESLANVKLEALAGGTPESPPALIVFDDVEGLAKPKAAALRVFEQAVKERGRKMGLHSLSIYHRGAANKSTQASLNEATGYVVFPKKMSTNTAYMLKTYADIPDEVVSLIRSGDWGRCLIIIPGEYLLGEKKAAIIDPSVISAIAKAEKKRMNQRATKALAAAEEAAAVTLSRSQHGQARGGAGLTNAFDRLSGLGYR